MALLQWDQKYSVGVPTLDAQHKNLFEMINAMQQAMLRGGMQEAQGIRVGELVDAVGQHFEREEKILRASRYPGLVEHRREHREFLEELEKVQGRMGAGASSAVLDMMDLLRQWWPRHLVERDLEYRQWLLPK